MKVQIHIKHYIIPKFEVLKPPFYHIYTFYILSRISKDVFWFPNQSFMEIKTKYGSIKHLGPYFFIWLHIYVQCTYLRTSKLVMYILEFGMDLSIQETTDKISPWIGSSFLSRTLSWQSLGFLCLRKVHCTYIRGFQIDNCVFQTGTNFVSLKCQLVCSTISKIRPHTITTY